MQFGQSTINVVLNEGQLPAKLSTDASGNTVLDGEGGHYAISTVPYVAGATAAQNYAAIQAALTAGGAVTIDAPIGTVIDIDTTLEIPSNTAIEIKEGVTLRKTGTTTTQIFKNSDPVNGNKNIKIFGGGTLDCNVDGVTSIQANIRNWNGLYLDNIDGLYVGGGLKIKNAYKYIVYGAKLTNFVFEDLDLYSTGAAGRDGIHLQGNSSNGVIQRITGTTTDDFIALNPRAIPLNPNENSPRGQGPLKNIAIRDIFGNTHEHSGAVVHLYSACYDNAAQTVFDGDIDAASPTSTKPAITGISVSGSYATVTTDKAHRMVVGDVFKISGANPSGYNADFGEVIDVPSDTTFVYRVDFPAQYISGAALTIYWQLDNITVENVRGTTMGTGIVAMDCMVDATVSEQPGGLFRNLHISGVSGKCSTTLTTSSVAAVMRVTSCTLINCLIENVTTEEHRYFPGFNSTRDSTRDVCRFYNTTLRNFSSKAPYHAHDISGAGFINISGYLYNMVIEGAHVQWAWVSGGWRHYVLASLEDGSSLTLRDLTLQGNAAGFGLCAVIKMSATCKLVLDNCVALSAIESLVDVKDGANVTGGVVVVSGGDVPASSTSAVTVYGNAIDVRLCNGFTSRSSNPPVRFLGSSTNDSLRIDDSVSYSAAACATITGTGPYSISGAKAKIDIANAKVSRLDGAIVYNTNAAAGTLAAAGLVVGQGTAANSWHLMADPTLVY